MTQPAWIPSFDEGLKRLGFLENESSVPVAATLRRRLHQPEANPLETLTLIETEQGFKWELGTGLRPVGLRSARRGVLAGAAPIGAPIWTSHFEKLQPGKLKGLLDRIDTTLTPSYGLSAWTKTGIVPVEKSSANKPKQRVLLLVHGTFSHGKMYAEALTQEHGKDFLTWALSHYDEILLFNHPTLAVSCCVNAAELAFRLDGCQAHIDVICHSRGGLVVRWWLDVLRPQRNNTRVVFVASPLAGTGLASPPRLTDSLHHLANVAKFLGDATSLAGNFAGWGKVFFTAGAGLMTLVSAVVHGAAQVGLADAAVQLVPGLSSMARMANNSELLQLRRMAQHHPQRFAIRSNYRPVDPGWQMWKYLTQWKSQVGHAVADALFAEDNDLVVDTCSMTDWAGTMQIEPNQVYDFGTSQVHHCAYFVQPQTYAFLRKVFAG